jgi:hypothetical protein
MTQDPVILKYWLMCAVYVTTACVNAVPIIYSFSPWRERRLGQLFMLQGVSFAVILDATVLFQIWHVKNVLVIFWTGVVLYSSISFSTAALAYHIWKLNAPNRKKVDIVQFSGGVYDFLKRAAQIYIPALGTLYFTVSQIWGLPSPEEVVGTIVAVDTFLGVILGISSSSYNNDPNRLAGTIELIPGEDGTQMKLTSVDPQKLLSQPEVTFKMAGTPTQ